VNMARVLGSILLGAITYDGNLLILEPGTGRGAPAGQEDGRGR
jgi:hypothetical protein